MHFVGCVSLAGRFFGRGVVCCAVGDGFAGGVRGGDGVSGVLVSLVFGLGVWL